MEAGVIEPPSTLPSQSKAAGPTSVASLPPAPGLSPEQENRLAVEQHVIKHIGRPSLVLAEEVSHAIDLEILAVEPRPGHDSWVLVTNGMSSRPLPTLPGPQHFSRLELMLCLPAYWQLTAEAFRNEHNYWPIRLLKRLARYPHLHHAPCDWGQLFPPAGEPFTGPLAEGVPFHGAILGYPTRFGPDFEKLMRSGHEIHFLAVYPLFREEMDLARRKGADALFQRMAPKKISELVDLSRLNTCAKTGPRKGLFAE